ncbi:MAG: DnaJ domain-containing protein [Clostridiales bacterium]|nr:DnaJ domain-containing protein [Clostridiales bacterium]
MRDPYVVLEINRGASKQEIQKAYRKLVKQYHPDQYRDHPLAKLAEEKLAEINAAYDMLMKNGDTSGSYSGNESHSYNGNYEDTNSGYSNSTYQQIRVHINNGNISAAEQMLDQMNNRTAQWYYLKGIVLQKKGWYSEAVNNLRTAVNMEPGNLEFRDALNAMSNNNQVYRDRSGQYGGRGMDVCDICQCLICTDCCCECMGGDFISCC